MRDHLLISVRMTLVLLLLCCGLYPAVVWGLGQLVFGDQANGSLLRRGHRVIGSSLIAQRFTADRYFHPRPSAAGNGYDAMNSSGSNLGPTSRALRDRIARDVAKLGLAGRVPADAVTTSASGLDPHISPANALLQVPRVAAARRLPPTSVQAMVERRIEERFLGIFGEPRVNVLRLNLDLDAMAARP